MTRQPPAALPHRCLWGGGEAWGTSVNLDGRGRQNPNGWGSYYWSADGSEPSTKWQGWIILKGKWPATSLLFLPLKGGANSQSHCWGNEHVVYHIPWRQDPPQRLGWKMAVQVWGEIASASKQALLRHQPFHFFKKKPSNTQQTHTKHTRGSCSPAHPQRVGCGSRSRHGGVQRRWGLAFAWAPLGSPLFWGKKATS